MSILLKQDLILAFVSPNTCSWWSHKNSIMAGLEGGIRPAFSPLKVFFEKSTWGELYDAKENTI